MQSYKTEIFSFKSTCGEMLRQAVLFQFRVNTLETLRSKKMFLYKVCVNRSE